jgi:hypothetical protein
MMFTVRFRLQDIFDPSEMMVAWVWWDTTVDESAMICSVFRFLTLTLCDMERCLGWWIYVWVFVQH